MPLAWSGLESIFSAWKTSFPEAVAFLILMAFFLGILLSFLDRGIYIFYEGRKFWPKWMRKRLIRRFQRKVDVLVLRAEKYKDSDPKVYDEIWYYLRGFPIKRNKASESHGMPRVVFPSRMGNLLESYEQYSLNRYGMDGVFYWYRLRLLLDKDARKEINAASAEADAVVYSSFGFLLSSFLYLVLGVSQLLIDLSVSSIWRPFGIEYNPYAWLSMGVMLLGFAYITYRLSIPLHRSYGEYFKSMFDIGRKKLKAEMITNMPEVESESEYWENLYYMLTYLQPPRSSDKGPRKQGE